MKGDRPAPPPRSSRSERWDAVEWASLDFEATGLDYEKDRVISFGVVPVRGGRAAVGEAVYRLVDPEGVTSSRGAVRVHGLLSSELQGGVTTEVAKDDLGAAIDSRFILAWFADVEIRFLDKLYGGGLRRWRRRTLDVRRLAIALAGDGLERASLSQAADRFGVPVADSHNALDDALVTAQLFLVTASKLASGGAGSVKHLMADRWLVSAGRAAAQAL